MTYKKPIRMFEDSGVVNPEQSYYVPLENVTNTKKQDFQTMIDLGRYFSIFAPRQSGKTTFFEETCKQLHNDPTYVAIILSFQDYKNIDKSQFYSLLQQDLYAQYTEETNQPFTEKAVKKIYEETSGQPWLVNRLGSILTLDIKPGTIEPIDEKDVDRAIQILLREKNNHFDNLYEKAKLYKETFVEIVFDHVKYKPNHEEQSWLEQFGLIKNKNGRAVVTNNIYKSRFVETFFDEANVPEPGDIPMTTYGLPDGKLDMKRIFLDFNRSDL